MSQDIQTSFKYNGAEFPFDMRDADDAEKYETAIAKLAEDEKNLDKTGKGSDLIRGQCIMLKTFFDKCLEEGAGVAVCGEKNNISVCYDAYDKFLEYCSLQKDDILRAKNTFGKYSNRQQRRHPEAVK